MHQEPRSVRRGVFRAGVFAGLIIGAATLGISQGMANDKSLRLGFGAHYGKPHVIIKDGTVTGGWIRQLSDLLSAELGENVTPVPVPRKRVAKSLSSGDLDVYCFSNPVWLRSIDKITWTGPVSSVKNLMIGSKAEAKGVTSPDSLRGYTVGTILGYSLPPALTGLFERNEAKRVNARSFTSLHNMLTRGRVDFAIIPDSIAVGLGIDLRGEHEFAAAPFVVSEHLLHCALSTRARSDYARVRSALSVAAGKVTSNFRDFYPHGHN